MSDTASASASEEVGKGDAELTVLELFIRARKAVRTVENAEYPSSDPRFEESVNTGIGYLQQIVGYSDSLFSPNDILEDIPTPHLKYALTHYYFGYLEGQAMKPDRARHVQQAKIHYMSFLKICEYLDLLKKQDKDSLEDDSKKDANTLRTEKIARYQREKDASAKMNFILSKEEQALKSVGGDPEMIENIGLDEEIVRDFFLAAIDLGISKTIAELKMIEQELQVLQMMASRPQVQRPPPPRGPQPSDKPITVQHIPKQGPPQTINLSDRTRLQQQVFQPGHRLPTMTMQEYVDEEIHKRGVLSSKSDENKEEDSDDEEVADRKTYKARGWDDWKDHNPRGAGNLKR